MRQRARESDRLGVPAWSIAEVAQMSGVTSRALRHYDAIGLLAPAFSGSNGFRSSYEQIAAGLAEYQRDAMAAYATQRLS